MVQLTIQQLCDLALQHHQAGRLQEAEQLYRRILAQQPNHADALHFLGVIAGQLGRNDIAVDLIGRAIALNPNLPEAYSNLGNALKDSGRFDEAIAACRQAIALKPDLPEAHNTLALILLLEGNFIQGWKEYEWRWSGSKELRSARWNFPQPQWDGSDLTHRTIYVHAEQGFGDTIQFIRYVPLVAGRDGKIVVRCQPELRRLLQSVSDATQWIMPGEVLTPFDVHCPLLSLPLAFGTTLETIPQSVPYLQADSAGTERWRERLALDRHGFKVGLAWAGYSNNTNDHNRSIPLSLLAPLASVKGVNFHSLQKGDAAMHARNPPSGLDLMDRTEDLKDFADTAALIANLDLVISVDTAVVHLAGAMGKPVWAMLPFAPDWRWQLVSLGAQNRPVMGAPKPAILRHRRFVHYRLLSALAGSGRCSMPFGHESRLSAIAVPGIEGAVCDSAIAIIGRHSRERCAAVRQ